MNVGSHQDGDVFMDDDDDDEEDFDLLLLLRLALLCCQFARQSCLSRWKLPPCLLTPDVGIFIKVKTIIFAFLTSTIFT